MIFFAPLHNDDTEEEEPTDETETNIDDSMLDEITEDTAGTEADTEGFGHIDETEDEEEDEEEESDDEESLEDDAEDVDFDTFDDVDEL